MIQLEGLTGSGILSPFVPNYSFEYGSEAQARAWAFASTPPQPLEGVPSTAVAKEPATALPLASTVDDVALRPARSSPLLLGVASRIPPEEARLLACGREFPDGLSSRRPSSPWHVKDRLPVHRYHILQKRAVEV